MIKNKNKPFDWRNFMALIGAIIDRPDARDALYELTREKNKKQIPAFKTEFIRKSQEISYNERKEYYKEEKVSEQTIHLIEYFWLEAPSDGTFDIDQLYEYDLQFGKLNKWFFNNQKNWPFTKVWLYSLGRSSDIELSEYSISERLFILFVLIYGGMLDKSLQNVSNGGVPLCKLLAVVMNVSSETTIKPHLRNLKYFLDFSEIKEKEKTKYNKSNNTYTPAEDYRGKNPNAEAAKKRKQLNKISTLMESAGANDRIKDYIKLIEEDYNKNFK